MKRNLTRDERLRKRSDFKKVLLCASKYQNNGLLIRCMKNGLANNRVGVLVNKKHGKAVNRNRVRRFMKEIFRNHQDVLKNGFDIVLIPQPGNFSYWERREQFQHLMKKACLWKSS